jgi:hypothetical protein
MNKNFFIIFIIILLIIIIIFKYIFFESFSNESIANITSIYANPQNSFIANNIDISNNANIHKINIGDSLNFPTNNFTYKLKNDISGLTISVFNGSSNIKHLTLDYSGNAIFHNDLNVNANLITTNAQINNLLTTDDFIIKNKIKSNVNNVTHGWKIWKQYAGVGVYLLDPSGVNGPGFDTTNWVVICVGNQFTGGNATGVWTLKSNGKWYGTACINSNPGGCPADYIGTFMAIPKNFIDQDSIIDQNRI